MPHQRALLTGQSGDLVWGHFGFSRGCVGTFLGSSWNMLLLSWGHLVSHRICLKPSCDCHYTILRTMSCHKAIEDLRMLWDNV